MRDDPIIKGLQNGAKIIAWIYGIIFVIVLGYAFIVGVREVLF